MIVIRNVMVTIAERGDATGFGREGITQHVAIFARLVPARING